MKKLIALALTPLLVAQASPKELTQCYQAHGQLEETRDGDKTTTVYKDPAQVAAGCNAKVLTEAQGEKDPTKVKELAAVIGKNSNWASSLPVFTIAAKIDAATCNDENALYGLNDALAHPATDQRAQDAATFMDQCWPKARETFQKLLKVGGSTYVKTNLCQFLKSKNAIPSKRAALCKRALTNG